MNFLFGPDSRLISALSKIGQMIVLNVLWLLGCVPILTIGTSTTAFYYAMIKSVRRGRSYPVVEFWAAYKRNFLNGLLFTVFLLVWVYILYVSSRYLKDLDNDVGNHIRIAQKLLGLLTPGFLLYLFPCMSRFQKTKTELSKLSFYMGVRHFPTTLLLLVIFYGYLLLQWYILPIGTVLIIPGAICLLITLLMERLLRKYMPEPSPEDKGAWYYE